MDEKKRFRHELKYLISYGDMEAIRMRLKALMAMDGHASEDGYKIRSLYFDDYWQTAYNDKLTGVFDRKKYRIRIYNDSDELIKLECKRKVGDYINKTSASLTRAETEAIIAGEFDFLLKKDDPVCAEFYYQCRARVLRPCVIVDYERIPFVFSAGDVRVTFDIDVRSSGSFADIFNPDLPMAHVLEDGKAIMEVKFTELLPKHIKHALSCRGSELTAMSKFIACYEKSNYVFIHSQSGI